MYDIVGLCTYKLCDCTLKYRRFSWEFSRTKTQVCNVFQKKKDLSCPTAFSHGFHNISPNYFSNTATGDDRWLDLIGATSTTTAATPFTTTVAGRIISQGLLHSAVSAAATAGTAIAANHTAAPLGFPSDSVTSASHQTMPHRATVMQAWLLSPARQTSPNNSFLLPPPSPAIHDIGWPSSIAAEFLHSPLSIFNFSLHQPLNTSVPATFPRNLTEPSPLFYEFSQSNGTITRDSNWTDPSMIVNGDGVLWSENFFTVNSTLFPGLDYSTSVQNNLSRSEDVMELLVSPAWNWWALIAIVFILAGLLGNALVCFAVMTDRRLQTPTNYFLLSLAVADLLVSVVVMPLGMSVEIMSKWENVFLIAWRLSDHDRLSSCFFVVIVRLFDLWIIFIINWRSKGNISKKKGWDRL